jgi:CubicO group peptidase (beta-lactamase class C family)
LTRALDGDHDPSVLVESRARHPTAVQSGVMVGHPPPPESRVGLHNWQLAPFNRWSFQHTRQVIATANVGRGPGPVWELPKLAAAPGNIRFDSADGVEITLADFLNDSWTDGLIVLKKGAIVFEAYRNGMEPQSRHIAMSVSKSITSLVVGALVGKGLIDVDQLVTHYVPELAGTAFDGATVQHLLDMTVANAWREDYLSDATEFWRLDVACGWIPPRAGAAPTLFDFFKETRRDGQHGEQIAYSSLNPDLLGLIAQRVADTPFPAVASRELWAPMRAEFDADMTVDPAGMAVADGGFCIALRDFARIGQLFLNGGSANGRQVVPESWISECRNARQIPFHPTSYGANLAGALYHNQWWQLDGRTVAMGIHGQMIAIDHSSDMIVAFLSSSPQPNAIRERQEQLRIVAAVSDALRA